MSNNSVYEHMVMVFDLYIAFVDIRDNVSKELHSENLQPYHCVSNLQPKKNLLFF